MSGARPETGARYVVELDRARSGATEVVYCGFVHLPDRDLPLEVRVALDDGATRASLDRTGAAGEVDESALTEHGRVAAALVRAATKTPLAAGLVPPRRIARWRSQRGQGIGGQG